MNAFIPCTKRQTSDGTARLALVTLLAGYPPGLF